MKHSKVVSQKNLPADLPLTRTVVAWLLLDRFHAPGWVWGAVGILFLIHWVLLSVAVGVQEQTEIWPDPK